VTKNSHSISSIVTITILVLPILFGLGYLLSILIYPIVAMYYDQLSLSFTIFGIFSIVPFLFPPPSKKLQFFCRHAFISFCKKILKVHSSRVVKFDNTMVHFATIKQSTTDASSDDEINNNDIEIIDITYFKTGEQLVKPKSVNFSTKIRNLREIWSLFSKQLSSIFEKICSISLKNSIFVLIFNSFFVRTAFIKSGREMNGFGGVPFEFRNGTQNQLQYKTEKSIKEVYLWVK